MKFENSFDVHAPIQDVWNALLDVERVAPCMPGAEVLEHAGDDSYKVGIKVKVGPISMLYRGQVEIVERDEPARQATLHARAKEARGQGTAEARIHMSLVEQPEGTHTTMETEMNLSGRAAAMGRGVISDVAERLVEEFAGNLARMLEPQPAAANGSGSTPAPARESAHEAEPAPAAHEAAPAQDTLPVGRIAAGVIAGRLRNPRTLFLATAAVGVACGLIGYAIGRSR